MAILTNGIKLSDFASMPEQEKNRRVAEISQLAMKPDQVRSNNQKRELEVQIQSFESRYKMTSNDMRCLLRKGQLTETAEICSWVMLLKMRDRFEPTILSQPTRP